MWVLVCRRYQERFHISDLKGVTCLLKGGNEYFLLEQEDIIEMST